MRTRSIWLTQFVLAASVTVVFLTVMLLEPQVIEQPTFAIGSAGIFVLTVVAMGAPWSRIPSRWILILPFADLIFLAMMSTGTDPLIAMLCAFPFIWIATYFSSAALAAALVLVGALFGLQAAFTQTLSGLVGLVVIMTTLLFIGVTSRVGARRTRAFKQLLQRQADRLRMSGERAAASEHQTVELLNAIDIGVARIGLDGRLRVVNETYAAMYGLDLNDLTLPARSVEYDDHSGSPLAERDRPYSRAVRGEQFVDLQVWLFDPTGSWRALSASSKRLDGEDDHDGSMLLIVHDVTATVSALRERQRLNAMASHEMRHPLTSVLGNAELALDYDEMGESARARLEVIHESSERLLTLLNDFLSASRVAPAPPTATTFDLRTVFAGSIESFAGNAANSGVQVVTELYVPLPVTGDAFRLRQVADNLVSNAIKYTREGGTVTVHGYLDGSAAIVRVADTGIGMTRSELAQVFDDYFRTDAAREMAAGTGLGMGISRKIVEEQGGLLLIDSEAGHGTVASMQLPLADDGADGQPASVTRGSVRSRP